MSGRRSAEQIQAGRDSRAADQDPRLDPLEPFFAASKSLAMRAGAQLALYAGLLILCLINFRGLGSDFLFNDDFVWLNDARHVMTPGTLVSHHVIGFFRPLVNLSFWAQERLFPGNLPLYHHFSLLLHFLNVILVHQLFQRLTQRRTIAVAVAILFAISDDNIGAVLWISARTTLLASFFLLSSLLVLLSWQRRRLPALGLSLGLFVLALAAKETAIIGCLLLLLIHLLTRNQTDGPLVRVDAVLAFAIVGGLYLGLRTALLGAFVQSNWGPGIHALRNLAGGAFNQLYPQGLFYSLYPPASSLPELANPLLPEILVLPAIGLLLWLGLRLGRTYPVLLGLGWMLLTLLPASLFRYRFLHYQSIQQTRYYYLSTIGASLVFAALLAALWERRSSRTRLVAAAIFILVCASSLSFNRSVELKWKALGEMYKPYIASVMSAPRQYPGLSTIVVENSALPIAFLGPAVNYGMPSLSVHEVTGGRSAAAAWKPCIYVWYTTQGGKVQVHYDAVR